MFKPYPTSPATTERAARFADVCSRAAKADPVASAASAARETLREGVGGYRLDGNGTANGI